MKEPEKLNCNKVIQDAIHKTSPAILLELLHDPDTGDSVKLYIARNVLAIVQRAE